MAQIDKSSLHFESKIYTGNGGTINITGMGFQPDFSWLKCRSIAYHHRLYDAVRGVTKSLRTDTTSAESTHAGEGLTAFNSDGMTIIQGSNTEYNNNNQTYCTWNWKAGGAGSANTDGDINSTASANTAAGFSVVKWTGNGSNSNQEIGTGLSEELKFVIAKSLATGGGTDNWLIYFNGVTDAQDNCFLFTNAAKTTSASGGTPNKGTTAGRLLLKAGSSSNANINTNALNYIAYCFAEKKGFSKFSTYKGNGNADGTFVYTGFKPAFILVKGITFADNWTLWDNKRGPINVVQPMLRAETAQTESNTSSYRVDLLSNGFKWRAADSKINANNYEYIYAAFAENPIVGSNNIPATAK